MWFLPLGRYRRARRHSGSARVRQAGCASERRRTPSDRSGCDDTRSQTRPSCPRLLCLRVSLDAGRDLWNTQFAHGGFPRAAARADFRLFGKPGRQVWLFPFKVTPCRADGNATDPGIFSRSVSEFCWWVAPREISSTIDATRTSAYLRRRRAKNALAVTCGQKGNMYDGYDRTFAGGAARSCGASR